MSALRRRVAAAATLAMGVQIGEGLLRIVFAWPATEVRLRTNSSLSFHRRWILEQRTGAPEPDSIVQYHPLLGWMNRPGLDHHALWIEKRLTTRPPGCETGA